MLADPVSKEYIMVGPAGRSVKSYKSKDLIHWEGPTIIYTAPDDVWGDIRINSIWAPELHIIRGNTTFSRPSTPARNSPSSGATGITPGV